jgi:hypothetical protein
VRRACGARARPSSTRTYGARSAKEPAIDQPLYLGLIAVILSLTQLFGPEIRALLRPHAAVASSFGGGAAIAYVFLVLLPELDIAHRWLGEHIHLVALSSFLTFYVIELLLIAQIHRTRLTAHLPHRASTPTTRAFWFHLGILAAFIWMVVFAMPDSKANNLVFCIFGTLTIALRLVYKDYILREHQDAQHQTTGRYLLAATPIAGLVAHYLFEPSAAALDIFVAILAGGILQSVFRQELPTADTVKLPWLLAGVAVFTLLVQIT